MGHTVLELLTMAAGYLEKKGVPSARREADALLGHVLACDRLHLYLRFEERPLAQEVDRFRALMKRRGEREPLQYILGQVRFLGRDFLCDPRALIPRPETEDLVKACLRLLGDPMGKRCADIGTGSGCIGISLSAAGAQVTATDLSLEALDLARVNAERLGCEMSFLRGNLLEPLPAGTAFDLVVSNPPYIDHRERKYLSPEVVDFEPAVALFAAEEGLALLRVLLDQAPLSLGPGGFLALECGQGHARLLEPMARAQGAWRKVEVVKDSYNVDRFLICERA